MSPTPSDDEADRTETQQQTCTAGNVFVFEHSPLAQASALDRKKKRDELTLAQQAYVSLCPNEMIACTVPGIDGAYEVSHIVSSRTGADSSASIPRPSLNHVVVVSTANSTTTVLSTTQVQDPSKSPQVLFMGCADVSAVPPVELLWERQLVPTANASTRHVRRDTSYWRDTACLSSVADRHCSRILFSSGPIRSFIYYNPQPPRSCILTVP